MCMVKKYIKMSEIIIPTSFMETIPKSCKMESCRNYYIRTLKFDRNILLNSENILVDGYVAYLIAKEFNLQKVPFIKSECEEQIYVYGKHSTNGKEYCWVNYKKLPINIGDSVLVNTKFGRAIVIVTKIKRSHKKKNYRSIVKIVHHISV